MASRSDAQTPGTIAYLKDSLLFNRSTALLAINYRSSGCIISKDEVKRVIQKALCYNNITFQSEEQREALYTIVSGN